MPIPFRIFNGQGIGPYGDWWDRCEASTAFGAFGDFWDKFESFWKEFYVWLKRLRPALALIANFIPAVGPVISAGLVIWTAADAMYKHFKKGEYDKVAEKVAEESEYVKEHSGLGWAPITFGYGGTFGIDEASELRQIKAHEGSLGSLEYELKSLAHHNMIKRSRVEKKLGRGLTDDEFGKNYAFQGTYKELVHKLYVEKKSDVIKANNGFAKEDLRWQYQKYDPKKSRNLVQKYAHELYKSALHEEPYYKQRYNLSPSDEDAGHALRFTGVLKDSMSFKEKSDLEYAWNTKQRKIMDAVFSDPRFFDELNRALAMFKQATTDDAIEMGDDAPWKLNDPAYSEVERIVRKFFAMADMGWLGVPRLMRLTFKEVDENYYSFTKNGPTKKIIARRFNTTLPPNDALVQAAQAAQIEAAVKSMKAVFGIGVRVAVGAPKVTVRSSGGQKPSSEQKRAMPRLTTRGR